MKKLFTLLMVFGVLSLTAQIPTNGLIGHYPLDNGVGTNLVTNPVTLTANATTATSDRNGITNGATSFNGTSSYISSGTSPVHGITGMAMTVMFWYYHTTALADGKCFVDNTQTGGRGWGVDYLGSIRFVGSSNYTIFPTLVVGNWYHIAFVQDGSTCTGYVNGQQIGTPSTNMTPLVASTNGFTIGRKVSSNSCLPGSLDEMLIYDRALTGTEVAQVTTYGIVFHQQPQNVTLCTDNTAVFSVSVSGATSFQWRKDGVNITNGAEVSGATSTQLTLSNIGNNKNGKYTCLATAPDGSLLSASASLYKGPASPISYFPMSSSVDVVGTNSLSTTTTLVADRFGNPNAAANYLTTSTRSDLVTPINTTLSTISFWYNSTATSGYRALLDVNNLSTYCPLLIGPSSQIGFWDGSFRTSGLTVPANQWVHIAIKFDGLNRQIYVNGQAGAAQTCFFSSATYPITVIGNRFNMGLGQVCYGAIDDLTVFNRALTTEELFGLLNDGRTLTLSAPNACGSITATPYKTITGFTGTYQWYNGNQLISGQTTSSYTATANGTYAASLTAGCYTSSASAAVTLGTVNITATNSTLQVPSSNTSYAWYLNGNLIPGATSATCNATGTGTYTVRLSSSAGCTVTTSPLSYPIMSFTQQPQSVALCTNNTAVFSAMATGATGYQWKKEGVNLANSTNIAGATSSSLTVTNVTPDAIGNYTCVASNTNGTQTSSNVTIYRGPSNVTNFFGLENNIDIVGGNSITALTTLATNRFGVANNAVSVTGTQRMDITNPINVSTATVSMWYYQLGATPYRALLETTGQQNYSPLLIVNGELGFWDGNFKSSGLTVLGNRWIHIAIKFDGFNRQIFLNGVAGPVQTCLYNSASFPIVAIGNRLSLSLQQVANGILDEVYFFDRQLTVQELFGIVNSGRSITINTSGTCGYMNAVPYQAIPTNISTYQWSSNGQVIGGQTNSTYYAPSTGTYEAQLTEGCYSSSASINVTVTPIAAPTITSANGRLEVPSTYSIYQWYLNNAPLPSSANYYFVPTVTGNYTVMVNDANGCPSTSAAYSFISGIEDELAIAGLSIYPNPTTDGLLQLQFESLYETAQIHVYNALGQWLSVQSTNETNATIQLPDTQGIYFIKVEANGKTTMVKVLRN